MDVWNLNVFVLFLNLLCLSRTEFNATVSVTKAVGKGISPVEVPKIR